MQVGEHRPQQHLGEVEQVEPIATETLNLLEEVIGEEVAEEAVELDGMVEQQAI